MKKSRNRRRRSLRQILTEAVDAGIRGFHPGGTPQATPVETEDSHAPGAAAAPERLLPVTRP